MDCFDGVDGIHEWTFFFDDDRFDSCAYPRTSVWKGGGGGFANPGGKEWTGGREQRFFDGWMTVASSMGIANGSPVMQLTLLLTNPIHWENSLVRPRSGLICLLVFHRRLKYQVGCSVRRQRTCISGALGRSGAAATVQEIKLKIRSTAHAAHAQSDVASAGNETVREVHSLGLQADGPAASFLSSIILKADKLDLELKAWGLMQT